jgi:hypothetical protein
MRRRVEAKPPESISGVGRGVYKDQRRHVEPGWYEWTIRELARYFYLLGVLALSLMVPLQLSDAWLPAGRPPLLDPGLVAFLSILIVLLIGYASWKGYSFLWRAGGQVDQAVEARVARQTPSVERGPKAE